MQPEDVFRTANDGIAEAASDLGWTLRVPFLCECSDERCFERVPLTLEQYEQARSHPHRYLTAPGHEVPGAFVIEGDERVSFVEKLYAST